ncbi:MAG TPA: acyl-CoA dehydrogenase family protein, partial [Acidobacteriota bacterium]|nr:acyl-CoA dehydrogenase family protein [Acidobacteriota bacterium]
MNTAEMGRADLAAWKAARPNNFFLSDSMLQSILDAQLGPRFSEFAARWEDTGSLAAGPMNELAAESNLDENLPQLQCVGVLGEPLEHIAFHPSYHELGALVWGTGVLSLLAEPGNETVSGVHAYLMAQNGEAGHMCPVACTAGAIKLIQRLGTSEQKGLYLPRLLDSDYTSRLHASQFLTEVQGGSDVGSNACTASRDERGRFRIHGEKWFCSVMDAGLFVVTARPLGAPSGTRGLGLFLAPRKIDDRLNGFHIRRLKSKLGTRSMATGEAEFQGALAEPIGPLEDGFKNAVRIVLDTSRLQNAVSACGILRRAFVEAHSFAEHRKAFGSPILQYPLVRATLAAIQADAAAALATTFRILDLTDHADTEDRITARRIHVMANKYWTSLRCTEGVHSAIEILGGNGTIEDFSILPRLYRDSIVLES